MLPRLVELVCDHTLFGARQRTLCHQPLDEVAKSCLRGDTSGRCVRLEQVAHLLQFGHVVANGGRANIEVIVIHQSARGHGPRGLHVLSYDQPQ